MTRKSVFLGMVLLVTLLCSCSRLPDFSRMQDTMDRMAYYTGMMATNMPYMAQSTARMAAMAERMETRSDNLLSELRGRGNTMERNVQLYAQSFLDNDQALIKALNGIRKEIRELKTNLKAGTGPVSGGTGQPSANERIQSKLSQLEEQLAAISAKMNKRIPSHSSSR